MNIDLENSIDNVSGYETSEKVTYYTRRIVSDIAQDLNRSKEYITTFKDNLDVNPMYAFEWGDRAMRAAAVINVGMKVSNYFAGLIKSLDVGEIDSRELESKLFEYIKYNALTTVSSFYNSSSQCHNTVNTYKSCYWGELLRHLEGI